MMDINHLSKIGIGTYRMSNEYSKHIETLDYAVHKGINLIDTASNYQIGNAEKLIGNLLKGIDRSKVFIVTKAGYIQGEDLSKYGSILSQKRTLRINDNFCYSIDKHFLESQINSSLKRMGTDYLDGFLIHNPEHYFDIPNNNQPDLYDHINEALFFLEGMVKKGIIRYYGISSNVLPSYTIDLSKILINPYNFPNFKLVQFPYNLVENVASHAVGEKESLITFSQNKKIKKLSNRPLNTTYQSKVLRLADYSFEISVMDEKEEENLFYNLLERIKERLQEIGESSDLAEFTPVNFFINNRKNIANPEAVDKAINGYLIPFLNQLHFRDKEVFKLIMKLRNFWILYSKESITKRALELKDILKEKGEINKNDNRDLSLIACEKYIEKGIDHVLVGLRKKEYIDKLSSLI